MTDVMENEPVIFYCSDGSYSVGGIVYNSYTKEPSKVWKLSDMAAFLGVGERTARGYLKLPFHFKIVPTTKKEGLWIMDYSVHHFKVTYLDRKYAPRSWKRGWDLLRKFRLVDRVSLLEKLQKRHDEKWTDIQRKFNGYDDSHVAAYQRGMKDAINIVRSHAIETWDYAPKLGQRVSVGGCGGTITKITDDEVIVSGTYHYYMGEGVPSYGEDWRFSYKLENLTNGAVRPYWPLMSDKPVRENKLMWNYEGIPHNSFA